MVSSGCVELKSQCKVNSNVSTCTNSSVGQRSAADEAEDETRVQSPHLTNTCITVGPSTDPRVGNKGLTDSEPGTPLICHIENFSRRL